MRSHELLCSNCCCSAISESCNSNVDPQVGKGMATTQIDFCVEFPVPLTFSRPRSPVPNSTLTPHCCRSSLARTSSVLFWGRLNTAGNRVAQGRAAGNLVPQGRASGALLLLLEPLREPPGSLCWTPEALPAVVAAGPSCSCLKEIRDRSLPSSMN